MYTQHKYIHMVTDVVDAEYRARGAQHINSAASMHPYCSHHSLRLVLSDCARDCLSERLKKEGKKTGVLKTSCSLLLVLV